MENTAVQEVADLDEALKDVWPGNLPEGERALWDRLPMERKQQVIRRVRALVDRSPPADSPKQKKAPAKAAAEQAELALPTFYAMERRWREARSIAALGIKAPDASKRPAESETKKELRKVVRRLLRYNPSADTPGLYAVVKHKFGEEAPSFGTVLRVVREMRRSLPSAGIFGRRLIFDSAGLDLVDEAGQRMRLCAVIDDETSLVLGWDLATDATILSGYRNAALHGAKGRHQIRSSWMPNNDSGFQDFDMSGGFVGAIPPDAVELRKLPADSFDLSHLRRSETQVKLDVTAHKNLGGKIMDAVGESIGGLWLGQGVREDRRVSYRSGRPVAMPVLNPTIYDNVYRGLKKHNDQILKVNSGFIHRHPSLEVIDAITRTLGEVGYLTSFSKADVNDESRAS